MKTQSGRSNPNRFRGIALLVSLLLLLITTLLALAGLRSTTLQERMSGNLYARGLVFQAAESVLRQAENKIKSLNPEANNSCPKSDKPIEPDIRSFWAWLDNEKPSYQIELPQIGPGWGSEAECEGGSDTTQYGSRCRELPNACYYRITSSIGQSNSMGQPSKWSWANDVKLQVIVRRRLEQQ